MFFQTLLVTPFLTYCALIQADTIGSRSNRGDEDEGIDPHKSCLLDSKVGYVLALLVLALPAGLCRGNRQAGPDLERGSRGISGLRNGP